MISSRQSRQFPSKFSFSHLSSQSILAPDTVTDCCLVIPHSSQFSACPPSRYRPRPPLICLSCFCPESSASPFSNTVGPLTIPWYSLTGTLTCILPLSNLAPCSPVKQPSLCARPCFLVLPSSGSCAPAWPEPACSLPNRGIPASSQMFFYKYCY